MTEALARLGFPAWVLCGGKLEVHGRADPVPWLAARGFAFEGRRGAGGTPYFRAEARGVPVDLYPGFADPAEDLPGGDVAAFLGLLDEALVAYRPDVVVSYGALAPNVLARARARGAATAFALHNFAYRDPETFADADAVVVPSRYSAGYYRDALGLDCTVLPNLVDFDRVRVGRPDPRYVTFVNPSYEKGVYAFARLADELGRLRPDIPLLVNEGRGDRETLAACGLDLAARGNLTFSAHPPDPRDFWAVTRVCLMPSLWRESQGLAAVEAMANGIPVVASDRGALPETVGAGGVVLPLPDRLTPATRLLPTAAEVRPWVEAVVRLWDDRGHYEETRRRALAEVSRWAPEVLLPRYERLFAELRPGRGAARLTPASPGRSRWLAAVLYRDTVDVACEAGLRGLERAGVRVERRGGRRPDGRALSRLASDALAAGVEVLLVVDPDVGFEAADALRLMARPEPVVAGLYPAPGGRGMAGRFAPGVEEAAFGRRAYGLYPLSEAPAGFLRLRTHALGRMARELSLPACDAGPGPGFWPFFLPVVVPDGRGGHDYLAEGAAFTHRLGLLGVTPLADTSVRLWRAGRRASPVGDESPGPDRHGSAVYRVVGP
jgi:hypothetical protein